MNDMESPDETDILTVTVPMDAAPERLDKVLAALVPDLSRTRLKVLIETGQVRGPAGPLTTPSVKVLPGTTLDLWVPEVVEADPQPENIPLDIIYEDDDLLVVNKSASMVVHPAVGHQTGTLVHALLYHCGDTLSGIGGVKRPGIVHRLDLGTSGVMVVAKNDAAHQGLAAQLADRSLGRIYEAVTFRIPVPPAGTIDAPIGRHKTNRLKMAVNGTAARAAQTTYRVTERFGALAARVECVLATGRTHQIRVHLAHAGYPLWGDPLYGAQSTAVRAGLKPFDPVPKAVEGFARQALHAREIHFIHPRTGDRRTYAAPPPQDFITLTDGLRHITPET